MAIIKFINDPADWTAINASVTTAYMDTTRIPNGWVIVGGTNQNMRADWEPPVGNDFWVHFVAGYSTANIGWDANLMTVKDASGTTLFTMGVFDGVTRWQIFGNTSPTNQYTTLAGTPLVVDAHFVKDGTTSVTLTVYVNGALRFTLTTGNTANRGMPAFFELENADTSGNFYFGECLVADEDTRGWRLVQLKPTSFGGDQVWGGTAASVTDGSLLTGISTPTVDARTSFGVGGIEFLSSDIFIERVCIQTYAQRGASGPTAFNHYFRYDGGTIVDDADIPLGELVDVFLDEYPTDPNTAAPWDPSLIQGLQIGVRART